MLIFHQPGKSEAFINPSSSMVYTIINDLITCFKTGVQPRAVLFKFTGHIRGKSMLRDTRDVTVQRSLFWPLIKAAT